MHNNFSLQQTEQIIQQEQYLLEALKNSDINRIDALLHEDLLFNIPNGQTITKAMDMEVYGSGNMKIHTIVSSEQSIRIIEDTAVVSVTIHLQAAYFDQAIDGNFRYLRVWKLFHNGWKVIAGSCVQL